MRTTVGVEVREGVVAACGVGCVVPYVGITSDLSCCDVYWIVDGQMQRVDLSTAVGVEM